MPWFCSELIADHTSALERDWSRIDAFDGRLHHVTSVNGHDFHSPEVQHGFPPNGLLFVRDLEPAPWHDDADDFALLESLPERAAELATDHSVRYARLLRIAKSTSVNLKCTVAFYTAFSWGGPLEAESAWVFTPFECHIMRDEDRDVTILTDESGASAETDRDHLSVLLEYFGIDSPTGYFAPHTSKFDWNQYLVHSTG